MPTYKRPVMLRRAVESVLSQTYRDWELIVSDDEDPGGEAWEYLQPIAAADARVRPVRNPGPHGQVGNNNFAMRQARGEWIKPLFDDDALKPRCLERMLAAADASPGAALIRCLVDQYEHEHLRRGGERGRLPLLERLDSGHARLAMYLQDFEIGTPIQAMIPRRIVHAETVSGTSSGGVWWQGDVGLHSALDTWWLFRILEHGPLLLLNETLADQHWGHETGTAGDLANPTILDRDFHGMRALMFPRVPTELSPPPVPVTQGQVRLMRAALRLRDRRPLDAARLVAGAWRPSSWRLAYRWARRQRHPAATPIVPRTPIPFSSR